MWSTRSRSAASFAAFVVLVGCGSDSDAKQGADDDACEGSGCPQPGGDDSVNEDDGGASGNDASVLALEVGKACESSADCGQDLICHSEPQNYIGHHQCTETCQGDTCPKGSKCIGAEICVAECVTSADCPAKSTCNKNGWCSRTGPGSGVPFCDGIASNCLTALDSLSCIKILGCSGDGNCGGVPDGCYTKTSSFECTSLDGCTWSSNTKKCSGVSRSCSGYSSDFACNDQKGCRWDFDCSGTANPCDMMPVSVCANQPGCFVNSGA